MPQRQMQLPIDIFLLRERTPSCIALVDWNAPPTPNYLEWNSLFPIFTTSRDSWQIRRFVDRKDPYVWGLPTWTQLELRKGFDIQCACVAFKDALIALGPERPETVQGFDFGDRYIQKDWLPLHAEPEAKADSPATNMEWVLAKLVRLAVQQVGWIPRDVYEYLRMPTRLKSPCDRKMDLSSQTLLDLLNPLETPISDSSHEIFMQHALSQSNINNTKFVIHFRTWTAQHLFLEELDWPNLEAVLRITEEYPEAHSLGDKVFEAIVHKVLPTRPIVPLFPMKQQLKQKKAEPFVCYTPAETSTKAIEVNFAREKTVFFDSLAPPQCICVSTYYKGDRMTPMIDGFLLSKAGSRNTLYFLQITTSQKKKLHSMIHGSELITEIIEKVKLTHEDQVTICFVLVGPMEDVLEEDLEQSWELPHPDFLGFPYEVYECEIPTFYSISGAQDW